MIRTIFIQLLFPDMITKIEHADECIMVFEKDKCIKEISQISNLPIINVRRIVEYFINTGLSNFLEFPLFELDNKLVTIPSLILVNDWQFTMINGHYLKKIAKVTEKTQFQKLQKINYLNS